MIDMYDFRNVRGHIEVYYNGEFLFAADTYTEAEQEVRERELRKEASVW